MGASTVGRMSLVIALRKAVGAKVRNREPADASEGRKRIGFGRNGEDFMRLDVADDGEDDCGSDVVRGFPMCTLRFLRSGDESRETKFTR